MARTDPQGSQRPPPRGEGLGFTTECHRGPQRKMSRQFDRNHNTNYEVLPDVLSVGLKVVFCGTAAGSKSAVVKAYYAGPGNKFWAILHQTGLTREQLQPAAYKSVCKFGIGLTDLTKRQSGSDAELRRHGFDTKLLVDKVRHYSPKWLCFNGKRAAQVLLNTKQVEYGCQPQQIADTRLFVAPSTSGAANGYWNASYWHQLAHAIKQR